MPLVTLQEVEKNTKNNCHHSQHLNYKIGNQVWVLYWNLQFIRPSKKLDYQQLAPFPIIDQVNLIAFQLQLLKSIKIHLIFYV
jgi:hypothetical protein